MTTYGVQKLYDNDQSITGIISDMMEQALETARRAKMLIAIHKGHGHSDCKELNRMIISLSLK